MKPRKEGRKKTDIKKKEKKGKKEETEEGFLRTE